MNTCEEPYSAIAEAFSGLFKEMKPVLAQEEEKGQGTFADLRELPSTELGSELYS